MEVTELSIPSSFDSFSIPIKVHETKSHSTKSIIFFIHGGIFTHGSKDCHPSIAAALAEHNVVVTASFRNGSSAVWKSDVTLRDLRDVLSWIEKEKQDRDEWKSLMVGLAGSSSVSHSMYADNGQLVYTNHFLLHSKTTGRVLCSYAITDSTAKFNSILHSNLSRRAPLQESILPKILHRALCGR